MLEPLFRSDGRRYRPSEHSRGPWDDRALHGGPVAALIGRALEQLPSDSPVQVARFTMEILRPVPLAPLEVATRIARPGRRVQLVSATVTAGDTEVCTASAWRMRTQAMNLGAQREAGDGDIPPPTAGSPGQDPAWGAAFHSTGVEM